MAKRPSSGEAYSNRALFERCGDPVFVLNHQCRLRYANSSWERLVRHSLDDLYNLHCIRDRRATPLAQALCPPPEVLAGSLSMVRRPVPPSRVGPPWWDVSFLPLMGNDGLVGIIGRIAVVGPVTKTRGQALPEGLVQLRHKQAMRFTFAAFDSDLPAFRRIVEQARLASRNIAPVVLIGESGTGKQWLARTIHHQGVTAERSFVAVDCSALPPFALEVLLFGDPGLGSPERVGTIYLRDPGALPRDLQSRLLGWLTGGTSDGPRIVAGCCRALQEEVVANRFLEELTHALSVQEIRLLPLRERTADLSRIGSLILQRIMIDSRGKSKSLSAEAVAMLATYSWPGNVREFESVLQQAAAQATGEQIDVNHLPEAVRQTTQSPEPGAAAPPQIERTIRLEPMLEQLQRRIILIALRQARGHRNEAARLLDLSRTELWRRMNQLGIGEDDWRSVLPREDRDAPPEDRRL